ncbi:LAETG motif-containing sortase-dependent surface protein [Streptomyces camelliae]|uniref:LPXTG cell wall anchor domain-containing protein n=1 Tax=Streptomyces camelliae TaxID=3004093 RepID=A0ABY7P9H0_9ACTN|nr:LAETG motif-containing sortase-dependent surface protein [Streptomyces sp. HUAS 2-6]WBO65456.1 LPXTG cell wall anchor domain-containing protein [Streptomyces sp. HUAS 2-6]
MFRSRHLTRAARVVGTSAAAAALSVAAAQTALACSIADFSAAPACDSSGKPVVRVTDKDPSGTPATLTLKIELSMPGGERDLDTQTIQHPTAQGVSVDLHPLTWHAGQTFVIHVKAGDSVDEDLKPPVVVPDNFTCAPAGSSSASPTPTAPASSAPTAPASSAPSATPAPVHSGGGTAASPVASSAPSPAGGGTHLASTGASGNTPLIAGAAAALVLAGAGIVTALRRRTAHRAG